MTRVRRWVRKHLSDLLELVAVVLVTVLVFRYWGLFWAGVPVAFYCVVWSIGLGRGRK